MIKAISIPIITVLTLLGVVFVSIMVHETVHMIQLRDDPTLNKDVCFDVDQNLNGWAYVKVENKYEDNVDGMELQANIIMLTVSLLLLGLVGKMNYQLFKVMKK